MMANQIGGFVGKGIFGFLMLFSLTLPLNTFAQEVRTYPAVNGIYGVVGCPTTLATTNNGPQNKQGIQNALMFANPDVDGLTIKIDWNQVEPAPGVFDWSYLDPQMLAAASKKNLVTGRPYKIALNMRPGISSPAWLFSSTANAPADCLGHVYTGSTFLNAPFFAYNQAEAQGGGTGLVPMPVPWDRIYLRRWSMFVNAVATHVSTKFYYSSIVLLNLTGINDVSDETRLPANDAYGDTAQWMKLGYRASEVTSVFKRLITLFTNAFPGKSLRVASSVGSFPAIDWCGNNLITNPPPRPCVNAPALPVGVSAISFYNSISVDYLMPIAQSTLLGGFIAAQNGLESSHCETKAAPFPIHSWQHIAPMGLERCYDPSGTSIDSQDNPDEFSRYCVSPYTDTQGKTLYLPLYTQAVWNGLGLISFLENPGPNSVLQVHHIVRQGINKPDQLCYPAQTQSPKILELQNLDSVLPDGTYSYGAIFHLAHEIVNR